MLYESLTLDQVVSLEGDKRREIVDEIETEIARLRRIQGFVVPDTKIENPERKRMPRAKEQDILEVLTDGPAYTREIRSSLVSKGKVDGQIHLVVSKLKSQNKIKQDETKRYCLA